MHNRAGLDWAVSESSYSQKGICCSFRLWHNSMLSKDDTIRNLKSAFDLGCDRDYDNHGRGGASCSRRGKKKGLHY